MNIFGKKLMHLCLAGLLLFMSAPAFSQVEGADDNIVVTGVVTDAALGTPMAGCKGAGL